jgi:hypothetical protein
LPPGDGSTTALAVLVVQRLPAGVRDPVVLPDEVGDPVVEDAAEVEELGAGVGVGGELLQAASDAATTPAAASATHTERPEKRPWILTPSR